MFAGDTKIWCKMKTEKDGITLQQDLDNLSSWPNTWQLRFNTDKCVSAIALEQNITYQKDYQRNENWIQPEKRAT